MFDLKLDIPLIRLNENKNLEVSITGEGQLGLILVCDPSDLKEGGKEKALEIARAIGYEFPKDLKILETNSPSFNLSESLNGIIYNHVIVFKFKADSLGLPSHLVPYYPYTFEKMNLVLSESLQDIKNNNDKKKKLWNAVKIFKPNL